MEKLLTRKKSVRVLKTDLPAVIYMKNTQAENPMKIPLGNKSFQFKFQITYSSFFRSFLQSLRIFAIFDEIFLFFFLFFLSFLPSIVFIVHGMLMTVDFKQWVTLKKKTTELLRRLGLMISGAISLAVEEINNHGKLKEMGHSLEFKVAETYGEEVSSIRQTAALWTDKVYAYIGPQETCVHEGRMAAAFNLPMISYVSLSTFFSNFSSFFSRASHLSGFSPGFFFSFGVAVPDSES